MSRRGILLLGLISLTVFTVTVLRIDRFVLAENHRDAAVTARILVRSLNEDTVSGAVSLAQLMTDERLSRQLVDHRLHQDGEVLERFGYLFRLEASTPLGDGRAFVAWPVQAGRTGQRVFVLSLAGESWAHPNGDLAWSGLGARPALESDGWLRLAD